MAEAETVCLALAISYLPQVLVQGATRNTV